MYKMRDEILKIHYKDPNCSCKTSSFKLITLFVLQSSLKGCKTEYIVTEHFDEWMMHTVNKMF